ncbi:MAG: hypothetical protein IKP28_04300 [Clostridia bacterium]|nr:hypothetical protein [Clostridia bacterium]
MVTSNLFKYFPQSISEIIEEYLKRSDENIYITLEEIRLRINKPLILKFNKKEKIFEYTVKLEDVTETLRLICENSIYSYQNQICNGFITVKGGHRVRNYWQCSSRRK